MHLPGAGRHEQDVAGLEPLGLAVGFQTTLPPDHGQDLQAETERGVQVAEPVRVSRAK